MEQLGQLVPALQVGRCARPKGPFSDIPVLVQQERLELGNGLDLTVPVHGQPPRHLVVRRLHRLQLSHARQVGGAEDPDLGLDLPNQEREIRQLGRKGHQSLPEGDAHLVQQRGDFGRPPQVGRLRAHIRRVAGVGKHRQCVGFVDGVVQCGPAIQPYA